jgi:competence protein ComEC
MVLRKWHIWAAAVAVVFFCFINPAHARVVQRIKIHLAKNQIAIIFISLTDGEATLIKSNDKNILINSGDSDSRTELNEQLQKMGIKNIDTLILTNPESSYIGNVSYVIQKYDVSKVMASDKIKAEFCADNKELCYLFDVLGQKGYFLLPNLKVEVFEESRFGALNLFLTYGRNTIYYMGFSDKNGQEKFIKEHPFNASIIKLSDYGKGYVLSQEFLKTLDPEMAILFHKNGARPNDDLINRLATEWVETYHLHYIGSLTFFMTPDSYEVGPFFE